MSIVLDSKIYDIDKKKDYEREELISQADIEPDQKVRKVLLSAAGFNIIDSSFMII